MKFEFLKEHSLSSTELYAITKALDYINQSNQNKFLIIAVSNSDTSLSHTMKKNFQHPLVQKIIESLNELKSKEITFTKIPSYLQADTSNSNEEEATYNLIRKQPQIFHTDF